MIWECNSWLDSNFWETQTCAWQRWSPFATAWMCFRRKDTVSSISQYHCWCMSCVSDASPLVSVWGGVLEYGKPWSKRDTNGWCVHGWWWVKSCLRVLPCFVSCPVLLILTVYGLFVADIQCFCLAISAEMSTNLFSPERLQFLLL